MAEDVIKIEIRAIDNASPELKKLSGTLGKLGSEATAVGTSFLNSVPGLRAFTSNLSGAAVGAGLIAGAATAATAAIVPLVLRTASYGEELGKLSRQTGVGTQQLDGLAAVAKVNETSIGELTDAMGFFARTLARAGDSTSDEARLLKLLGLSMAELNDPSLNLLDKFLKIGDAIGTLKSQEDKLLVAQTLLGRGNADLVHFFAQGSAAIKEQVDGYAKLSPWTAKAAADADKFGDSLSNLATAGARLSAQLFLPLIDLLNQTIDRSAVMMAQFNSGEFRRAIETAARPLGRLPSPFQSPAVNAPAVPQPSTRSASPFALPTPAPAAPAAAVKAAAQASAQSLAETLRLSKEAEEAAKSHRKAIDDFIKSLRDQLIAQEAATIQERQGTAASVEFIAQAKLKALVLEHGAAMTAKQRDQLRSLTDKYVEAARATEQFKNRQRELQAVLANIDTSSEQHILPTLEDRRAALEDISKRDGDVLQRRKTLSQEILSLETELRISTATPDDAARLKIIAGFDKQRQAIEELRDAYPELADEAARAFEKIGQVQAASLANLAREQDKALSERADRLADDFVSTFTRSLESGQSLKNVFKDFFKNLGSTLIQQELKNSLSLLIKPILGQVEGATGGSEKSPPNVAGLLTGGIKLAINHFFPGLIPEKAATPAGAPAAAVPQVLRGSTVPVTLPSGATVPIAIQSQAAALRVTVDNLPQGSQPAQRPTAPAQQPAPTAPQAPAAERPPSETRETLHFMPPEPIIGEVDITTPSFDDLDDAATATAEVFGDIGLAGDLAADSFKSITQAFRDFDILHFTPDSPISQPAICCPGSGDGPGELIQSSLKDSPRNFFDDTNGPGTSPADVLDQEEGQRLRELVTQTAQTTLSFDNVELATGDLANSFKNMASAFIDAQSTFSQFAEMIPSMGGAGQRGSGIKLAPARRDGGDFFKDSNGPGTSPADTVDREAGQSLNAPLLSESLFGDAIEADLVGFGASLGAFENVSFDASRSLHDVDVAGFGAGYSLQGMSAQTLNVSASLATFGKLLEDAGGFGGGGLAGGTLAKVGQGVQIAGQAVQIATAALALLGDGGTIGGGYMFQSNLPSWVKSSSNIPKLAAGALVKGPTLALIGESGENEFVVPQSKMHRLLSNNDTARGGNSGGGGPINQNIYVVDSRPRGLTKDDLVIEIAKDTNHNGKIAQSIKNVIRRTQ